MGYQRLTEGQEEQIVKMSDEGKSAQEIADFFKATYKVKLPAWKIPYIRSKVKKNLGGGVATNAIRKAEKKRLARRHSVTQDEPAADEVNIQELVTLLQQIDSGYKKLLSHFKDTLINLRSELLKSRAEVHGMMKNAGIEVQETEEAES